ncbi:hypothetical protein LBMAG56_25230 [Verrucomicrobiota bacterium]|nr:hypothetical protein LBMAG56_25230 [Verrucomicrobiota bacterium]
MGFNWSNGTGTAEIYSQSGQLLTNVTASAGGKGLNFTLPSSETYMILVHDSSYNAVATYSLSLQTPTGGGFNGRVIAGGQTLKTNTTLKAQIDAYSYTGTAGQMLSLGFSWSNGTGTAEIYTPSGQLMTNVTAVTGGKVLNFTLPSSGIYTILVHYISYNAIATYSLSLQTPTGGGFNGVTIPCGQTINGAISLPSQINAYELVATAGEHVILSSAGFAGMVVDIYNSSGSNIISMGGSSSTNYTFATTDLYTLLVHDNNYNYSGTGSYGLTLTVFGGCVAVPTVSVTPTNLVVPQGAPAIFTAAASGPAPLYYQWRLGTNQLMGATNATYIIPSVQPNNVGGYAVVVSNPGGSVTNSPLAQLSIGPVVSPIADTNINELVSWQFTPAGLLSGYTYSLSNAPPGMTVDSGTGIISWNPTEAQGPSTSNVTFLVTQAGSPLGPVDSKTFSVTVNEVNLPPVLTLPGNTNINELVPYTAQATATDADSPANPFTFALVSGPAGLTVSPTGAINWTPTESQGPGTYTVAISVTDTNAAAVNAKSLSVTNSYTIVVNEVNSAPTLIGPTSLNLTNPAAVNLAYTATDPDVPANTLTFLKVSGPAWLNFAATGATNAALTGTPPTVVAMTNYTNVISVVDNGTPAMSNTVTVVIRVNPTPNTAPQFVLPTTNIVVTNPTALNIPYTARDTDVPVNSLTFLKVSGPAWLTFAATGATNAALTGTPPTVVAVTSYTNVVSVVDNGTPAMSNTVTVVITVNPMAGGIIWDLKSDWSDVSNPNNVWSYNAGSTVLPHVAAWRLGTTLSGWGSDLPFWFRSPSASSSEWQAGDIIVHTQDDYNGAGYESANVMWTSPITGRVSVSGSVWMANNTPSIDGGPRGNRWNLYVRGALVSTGTITGGDAHTRANPFAFAAGSGGASALTSVLVTGGDVVKLEIVRASSDGSFVGANMTIRQNTNSAPALVGPTSINVTNPAGLNVSYTARDTDIPANTLTFLKVSGPAWLNFAATGATNAALTGTPPTTAVVTNYTAQLSVVDNGGPAMSNVLSLTITVNPAPNTMPVLPVQSNRTIAELTQLVVTNTATDADLPANVLTYVFLTNPPNATIDATGVIRWTPTEAQGPSTNVFTTKVTDNGSPNLSATNTFMVIVTEVNTAPVLNGTGNFTNEVGQLFTLPLRATDSDVPTNRLTFTLTEFPAGMTVDGATGLIQWTPTASQVGTNRVNARVTDDGVPPLSNDKSFLVVVTNVTTVAGSLQFAQAANSVGEADGSVTITVTRTGGSSGAVGVSYATANGTAAAGSDYTATSGTLAWAAGDAANKTITVPILNDTTPESSETFTVALSTPTGGATLGTPSTVTVTITDDDPQPAGTLQFTVGAANVGESAGSVTLTVSRIGGTNGAVGVSYATANGTAMAGSDYTATSGTLAWAAGDTASKTITVPILNATTPESSETFTVALSTPTGGATLGTPSTATVTITDDDPQPAGTLQFTVGTANVGESAGSVLLNVSRTGGTNGAVGVSYATANGTATAGSDYTATSGTLAWAAGDAANKTITVPILNDTTTESSETFTVLLSTPTGGATLGTPSTATVTITDDDIPQRVVRLTDITMPSGSQAAVPVVLTAQGNESAAGFSVTFDPAILTYVSATLGSGSGGAALNLNTNQTATGRLGVALSLSAGNVFPAGAQELLRITFQAAVVTNPTNVPVAFGDVPVGREVSDATANVLPTTFTGGTVSITTGYEADVIPSPNGDGTVSITDWVKVGRFAAGLDVIASPAEFQRVDCAPRATLGDGIISIIDWVQAGRYAAGLDPLTPAGGPTGPGVAPLHATATVRPTITASGREVRVVNATGVAGQSVSVTLQLAAQGDENALGFSVNFDPAKLAFTSAVLGSGAAGATLNANTNQAAAGRLGIGIALPANQRFTAGTVTLLTLTFQSAVGSAGQTAIGFGNVPIRQEVSDALATTQPALFTGGMVNLAAPPNTAPVLQGTGNFTNTANQLFTLQLRATDADRPTNTLTFNLTSFPAGMTVDPATGGIRWTPTTAQAGTNRVVARVTDNGVPPLYNEKSFLVVVPQTTNTAPVLIGAGNVTNPAGVFFTITLAGRDYDVPINTLTFSLTSGPAGMTVDPATGVLRWTPTAAQVGTNRYTARVTDNGVPPLFNEKGFLVIVTPPNLAPVLPAQTNRIIAELTQLVVTNTATDADLTNTLTYQLLTPPTGATIDTNGVIRWTPTEAQGPSTNLLVTRVTDNSLPNLSTTNYFTVIVTEVNSAPVLFGTGNFTNAVGQPLTVNLVGRDYDLPANVLTYSLTTFPSGMTVDPVTGVIRWTPTAAQVGTSRVMARVTDNGVPALFNEKTFTVLVPAPIGSAGLVSGPQRVKLPVVIQVEPDKEVGSYAVSEILPLGWELVAGSITPFGVYDRTTRTINWGPFYDAQPRTLRYSAQPGGAASGVFLGRATFDGVEVPFSGRRVIVRSPGVPGSTEPVGQ